jgi:hypothetical protein
MDREEIPGQIQDADLSVPIACRRGQRSGQSGVEIKLRTSRTSPSCGRTAAEPLAEQARSGGALDT